MAARMVNILNTAGIIHTMSETDYNTHYKGKCVRLAQADLARLSALDAEIADKRKLSKTAVTAKGEPDTEARIAAAANAASATNSRKTAVAKLLGDSV